MTAALFVVGLALAVAGVAMIYVPGAFIAGGAAVAAIAWRVER